MRWPWTKPDPDPPENVRVVLTDGRCIPLELVYVGKDADLHVWEGVHLPKIDGPSDVADILWDRLPAKTTISLNFHIGEPPWS